MRVRQRSGGLTALLSMVALPSATNALVAQASNKVCRSLPGDSAWPSTKVWNRFNQTIGGRLIAGIPLAQPCSEDHLVPSLCSQIRQDWTDLDPFIADPVTVPSLYWLNNTCSPFSPPDVPCTLGNLASYAIEVDDSL
ncbi:hypothetical protein O1611_g8759 [Lasiodiplodia mahajangana]|uniref:Uncharacterized protein n=1 Tax=Lasiodiplodia mahajangana TaxID=1108764 RepID=A0ACC2JBK8_9PEZI|nr:hypothetical protein O1611_g8759 [Lasiodiplodia mahajangana]